MGERRSLDADAVELRTCAGTPRPATCGTAHERTARMIETRAGGMGRCACRGTRFTAALVIGCMNAARGG